MRLFAGALFLCFVVLVAASFVLLATWLLSLPLQYLLGLPQFQAGILAMGALMMVVAFFAKMGWRSPWEIPVSEAEGDELELAENESIQAGPEWFQPCPCDSKKPFARCCGKRAFKMSNKEE